LVTMGGSTLPGIFLIGGWLFSDLATILTLSINPDTPSVLQKHRVTQTS
jgi:hypothetical protein